MKRTVFVLVLTLGMSQLLLADGIEFFKGDWKAALESARKQNKLLFVDFYATWCGPCIHMSKTVFPDAELGSYVNQHFVSVKINAEEEEQELVGSVNLEAYPTLVFFTSGGEIITRHVGYLEIEELRQLAEDVNQYPALKQAVVKGNATRNELVRFLTMARQADRALFDQYAPGILQSLSLSDLQDADTWKFVSLADMMPGDDLFKKIIAHTSVLSATHSDFAEVVFEALNRQKAKAVAAQDRQLMAPYKDYLKMLYDSLADQKYPAAYFDLLGDKDYYRDMEDLSSYAKSLVQLTDQYHTGNASALLESALELAKASSESEHQAKAVAWAEQALKLEKTKNHVYSASVVFYYTGRNELALKTAQQLYTFELDESEKEAVDDLVKTIQEG
ncbi:MAG: thioredoxin family protein [Cyclobacteriaceae bacterium]|nr:thioredoxin family protein [Cyclobacteriaceae bacterium]